MQSHLRVVVLHCLPQHLVLPLAGRHHHPPCPPDAGVSEDPVPCNLTAGVHDNHALLEAVRKQPCHIPQQGGFPCISTADCLMQAMSGSLPHSGNAAARHQADTASARQRLQLSCHVCFMDNLHKRNVPASYQEGCPKQLRSCSTCVSQTHQRQGDPESAGRGSADLHQPGQLPAAQTSLPGCPATAFQCLHVMGQCSIDPLALSKQHSTA